MVYLFILIGVVLGIVVGNVIPAIPYTYSIYLSVAIIAALDSIFGAIASNIKNRFDAKVFVSGFFGNAILTILLAYLGQKLNVDIYLAAIIVFVGRMFNNLSILRRHYMDVWEIKVKKYKKLRKNQDKVEDKDKDRDRDKTNLKEVNIKEDGVAKKVDKE